MASRPAPGDEAAIAALGQYTACDVSDALLKLKVPGCGVVSDLFPVTTSSSSPSPRPQATLSASAAPAGDGSSSQPASHDGAVTVAPASTVLFVAKGGGGGRSQGGVSHGRHDNDEGDGDDVPPPQPNIPAGAHWADLTPSGTVVVLSQPDGQANAVCGGIMAARMAVLGARGVVVLGRARDVEELRATGLPIWARGLSTAGAGASSKPWAVQVPVRAGDTVISPGDLLFLDPANGVVVIPRSQVGPVLELLPRLTGADDKVKGAVAEGMTVAEAFRQFRGNL